MPGPLRLRGFCPDGEHLLFQAYVAYLEEQQFLPAQAAIQQYREQGDISLQEKDIIAAMQIDSREYSFNVGSTYVLRIVIDGRRNLDRCKRVMVNMPVEEQPFTAAIELVRVAGDS